MIEIVNNTLVKIDDEGNMVSIDDKYQQLYVNMQKILGDKCRLKYEDGAIEVEDIYYYIVEKIYALPTYAWDAEFKDRPKQKLNSAFNKFIHDKILFRFVKPYWDDFESDAGNLRQSNGKFLV